MFAFALIVLVYGTVMLCLGKIELFYQGGVLASYSIMAIIILLIGLANHWKRRLGYELQINY